MKVEQLIKKCLIEMCEDGEFERLREEAKSNTEKRKIRIDENYVLLARETSKDFPIEPLIYDLKSLSVVHDLLAYMIDYDERIKKDN